MGDKIYCIQIDRDLWRIYLKCNDSRSLLLVEGFEFKNISVQVYDSNPFATGAKNPKDAVLKVTISDLPLSVDDKAVYEMLKDLNISLKSDLKYEKIRNPTTKRMTSVLNGNRFIYIAPLDDNVSLPRYVKCAGLKCRLFHYGQTKNSFKSATNIQCYNCWETGHTARNCSSKSLCRVCRKEDHEPGSPECPHYAHPTDVIAFQGKDDPLSNFYESELKIFGETHKTAEHAYQLTKALRAGNIEAAERVRNSDTALDAKRIGHTVKNPDAWDSQKRKVMEEIISAKAEQLPKMQDIFRDSTGGAAYAHSTLDTFWGTGLNSKATMNTDNTKWPGENTLGQIMKKVSVKYARKLRSASLPVSRH